MTESSKKSKTSGAANLVAVDAIVRPVLQAHGLELFDLSFRLEQAGWVLRVIIDAPRSESERVVTVDHCAEVSRDLSTALDVADSLAHAYTLEVSTPGVERPLRDREDYLRFQGRLAKITLSEPMDGVGAVVRGLLGGIEDDALLIDVREERPISIPLSGIKRANLVYEMSGQPKKGSSKNRRRSNTQRRD